MSPLRSRPLVALILGLIILLAMPACQTFESRAKEKAFVFASLDEPTRTRLKAREIQIGDTFDLVYIALGKPTEARDKISAEGRSTVWIYSVSWQEYQGTRLVGYRRDVVYNPSTKRNSVSYTPDYQPIYAPRIEDRLRVTFIGGRVSAIEQAASESTPPDSAVK